MTYCLAIALQQGLVFASDTRTNAGIDHVSNYPKCHSFVWPGDRMLVLLSAGNLATTQALVKQLELDLEPPPEGQGNQVNLRSFAHLNQVAEYIGGTSTAVQQRHAGMAQSGVNFEASFILGGQIAGEPPGLYLIYPQGNYIGYPPEQPFLQIGETKYGKPILDRVVQPDMSLEDAARAALVSLDSTMRSNLSVGAPIDLMLYPADSLAEGRRLHLADDADYYRDLRERWAGGLLETFRGLPQFDWEGGP